MDPRVAPYAAAAGLGACCIAVAASNPNDQGTPLCPTKALTGLDCPFCGGLRAVSSLVRGHPLAAADHNLVVVALAPIAVAWWLLWARSGRQGNPLPRTHLSRVWTIAVVVALVGFTVLRNIGGTRNWLYSTTS